MKKKLLALMLTALMLLSVVPFAAVSAATMGDVDGDGALSATDARLALRASVSLEVLEGEALWAADIDGDGQPSAADARMILRASVGLENLHTHSYKEAITTPATCEGKGIKTLTCDCGDTKTEEIPALGHKAVADAAIAPTCTAEGKTEGSHCSVCNKVLVAQQAVAKKAHTTVKINAVEATCTQEGKTAGEKCSVCGTVTKAQQTVAKKAHTIVTDAAVKATCTKTGLTEGKHCSVCGTVTKAQTTIPAKGHTEETIKGYAATCDATGKTDGKRCSVCKTVTKEQTTIPKKGHTEETIKGYAATCTAAGKTDGKRCTVCKTVTKKQTTIPAKGHTEETIKGYAATCDAPGMTDGKRCTVCKTVTKKQTTIPKKGHTEETMKGYAATCDAPGMTDGKRCSVCETVIKAQTEIPAKGHDTVAVNALSATCTEGGIKAHYKCNGCGKLFRSAEAITEIKAISVKVPAIGHSLNKVQGVEVTCERNGIKEHYKCSFCGGHYSDSGAKNALETVEITAKGHDYGDIETVAPTCAAGYDRRVCKVCEYEEKTNLKDGSGEHIFDTTESFPAVCGENSYTIEKCSVCGTYREGSVVEQEGTAKQHNFGEYTTVAPTCTEKGYKTRTCKTEGCGYEERTDFTDASGHNYNRIIMMVAAECVSTGYRKSQCSVCNEFKVEVYGLSDCEPGEAVKVAGSKSSLTRAAGSEGHSCQSVTRCENCEKVLVSGESRGAHSTVQTRVVTRQSCTTPHIVEKSCIYCDYTETVQTLDAAGHNPEIGRLVKPTCTEEGSITAEGYCDRCDTNIPKGEPVKIPAKGHTLDGIQTCTTGITCVDCGHIEKAPLGHSYTKISAATGKSIDTFYCTRCGKLEDTKNERAETFNAVVNKLKTEFYPSYSDDIATFSKEKNDTTISKFSFGIYTSLVKDMYEEQMTNIPDVYTKILTSYSVREKLPLYNTLYTDNTVVSEISAADADAVTVERLSGLDLSSVLSSFNTKYTVGSREYDLNPYKSIRVNGNVIKVTVDVKNESYYGGIDKLGAAEKTALQKIYGLDVRADLDNFEIKNGKLALTVVENAEGANMTMTTTLNELTTDGRVTYYFLEETYEPIIAVYDVYQTMDQDISMSFSMGISIRGTMDPYVKTTDTIVYVFPGYIPQ